MDLRIQAGEFLSFLGPSGCGKTTALRMLAGFETPSDGRVLIGGEDVSGLEPYRRPVNMVFQSYALFPHMTVSQNIAYGLDQRRPKLPKTEIASKVQKVLETVRLSDFGTRRIWEMSGGQQQRVALARAIVNEPKLLLLDEPLAALDRKLRKEMQIELQDIQRQLGITFILVTHDQEEALSLSDRICVMRAGEIIQVGSPQDLYDRPRTRYVADFVGTSNFFEGTVSASSDGASSITLGDGKTYVSALGTEVVHGEAGCLSIRPEQIRLSRAEVTDGLAVTVQNRIFLGEHTEYVVRHDRLGTITALAPRQTDAGLSTLGKGDAAWVHWTPDAALILRPD
ncbi:ABC transporter ATP-binding protein [Ovoidimarina sediminis]|uniref:ABC transporter ATP-binding protein n=1 Tax=Ovoidimarina sediminis TaxID=3079856 RepID=UPI002930D8F2|nr:ABC transporter ATP-binding protein [Rhodophyticola sp. MJ-SS7]